MFVLLARLEPSVDAVLAKDMLAWELDCDLFLFRGVHMLLRVIFLADITRRIDPLW